MTRLQAPDSNAYDVLGVSPDDSAQDIDAAFHRLIDEGGYRIGVPLRGQWLRARQIKEAYATLGDPIKRRAYDEALKTGSEPPLWPATPANDPVEAELIRPLSEWRPPPEPTPGSTAAAPGSGDGEQASAGAIGSGHEEIDPSLYVEQRATLAEDEAGREERKYGPAKLWGGAAAATLAIGSLLYFTWPSGNPQLPDTEMAARPPAAATPARSGAQMTGELAEPPQATEPDGPFGEVQAEAPASGATEAAVPGAAPAQVATANQTHTGTGAAAAPGAEAGSATAPALAPPSPGQTSTAAAAVAAVTPAPAAPPSPAVAPPSPAPRVVPSPAQFVGGGPTRADNPRGRHVGIVVVQFTVQADGRVSNCGAVRSSGKADLDALTCRLVEQRMRFEPARDAQGNPVASTAHARYEWGRRRRYPSLLSWIFR